LSAKVQKVFLIRAIEILTGYGRATSQNTNQKKSVTIPTTLRHIH